MQLDKVREPLLHLLPWLLAIGLSDHAVCGVSPLVELGRLDKHGLGYGHRRDLAARNGAQYMMAGWTLWMLLVLVLLARRSC